MAHAFLQILEQSGEDPTRDGLADTPKRAASATKLTKGYREELAEIVNDALFKSDTSKMIIVQDIELHSMCEHHLLPFIGKCHVAYLPTGKVHGLTKFARIVDMYARRLQIQENLTKQIAGAFNRSPTGQASRVIIEVQHMCMMLQGVEKQNSMMKTSMMLGQFQGDQYTSMEFLSLLELRR